MKNHYYHIIIEVKMYVRSDICLNRGVGVDKHVIQRAAAPLTTLLPTPGPSLRFKCSYLSIG